MATRATFKLAPEAPQHFLTPQKARTEALRALAVWQARAKGRRFTVLECRDDFVISKLSWRDGDESASPDLGASCEARGLVRNPPEG